MPTREEDAYRLAQAHYSVDEATQQIYRIINDEHEEEAEEPIKLLEIHRESLPTGVWPVYFRARPPFTHYPTAIVKITPEEFDGLRAGQPGLRLPTGWRIDDPIDRSPTPVEAGS